MVQRPCPLAKDGFEAIGGCTHGVGKLLLLAVVASLRAYSFSYVVGGWVGMRVTHYIFP